MQKIEQIKEKIQQADAVMIGAGAGLSTAAGFTYAGKRFQDYFGDFEEKYDFHDMYSGGFHPYETMEEFWAYWSRNIYVNRYMDAPKPLYKALYELVKDKDYFVLTTNVDHCFQKAGFDKKRLFYTQGDYGLLQCSKPCSLETYDNEAIVREMILSQGFEIAEDGALAAPKDKKLQMKVPTQLVPHCLHCGRALTTNLRADAAFVQDKGWDAAAERYDLFERRHKNAKIVYLEAGVGFNTPGIIKYNFWQRVSQNPGASYICMNLSQAQAPDEIKARSICIAGDMGEYLEQLVQ